MNSRWLFSALLVCAIAGASYVRANESPQISVQPALPKMGAALQVDIDSAWGDACPPRFDSARIDGFDITVLATRDAGRCAAESTPYRISTGLDAAAITPTRDGIYHVRYEVRDGDKAEPELLGFRLLQVGEAANAGFVPETGVWWPEPGGEFGHAGPGIGMQIEVQSGTVSMSALGYAGEGQPVWYFGVGALQGRVAHLDMSLLAGGSGPFETYAAPKALDSVGHAELEVISPSRAVLWFVRAQPAGHAVRVEPISIVRFSFAQEPGEALLGRWLVVAESDATIPTRRIALAKLERKPGELLLRDADAGYALLCESPAALPNSPPGLCRLESGNANEAAVEFTDIGLQQMRGWDANGKRIVAFRVEP